MAYMTLAASVGNGNASFQETGSRTSDGTTYKTYQFSATADSGWGFSRWEMRSRYTNSGSSPSQWSSWSSLSTNLNYTHEFRCLAEYSGGAWGDWSIIYEYEVRAVFAAATYTVTVVASPANGGTVTGGGQYQAGSACTITATPNSGYYFVKWTSSDGDVTTNNPHPFTVTKHITWTAKFHLCTNLLLHGSSNTLLHGSSGTLLHDS